MLGALFFAGEHFLFEALIFGFVLAAPARPGNRAVENVAALHFDQHFRGAAHDGNIVHLQIEKIRRRIESAQFTINLKWCGLRFRREALADHHLKNIAGTDVALGFANGFEIFRASEIGSDAERRGALICFFLWLLAGRSLLEQLARFANLAHCGVVLCAEAAFAIGVHIANDPEAMLHVIEGNDAVIEHQHCVVEADVVAQAFGEPLDEADHVVRKIADGAGHERRQSRQAHGTEALHACAKKRDGIALLPNDAVVAFQNAGTTRVAKYFLGIRASESVTGDFFAAFDAFEQKRISRALSNAQIGADRCEQIGRKHVVDGDEVSLFCEALEFAEVRLNHGSVHGHSLYSVVGIIAFLD